MATVTRVGVVADTHVGDWLPRLPATVKDALEGVDLILHVGDLTVPGVISLLEEVAPVVAVAGNHDKDAGVELPSDVTVQVGDLTVGVTHGHRPAPIEALAVLVSALAGRTVTLGLERTLARRFRGVDCVVFGHWHVPILRRVGGTIVFSPGAVYTPEHDRYRVTAQRKPRAVAFAWLRRRMHPRAHEPAVGILEICDGQVTPHRIPLDGSLHEPWVPASRSGRPVECDNGSS